MNQSITSLRASTQEILQGVVVRVILPEERERWDQLIEEHHYLGRGRLIGESLRYISVYQDQWLALLGWASAALHGGARDKLIGWTAALRQQRLQLIVNNVRFLILPDIQIKNLASRILGLNVRRLSKDWEARFNHPLVLAETFVDPQPFLGTCYLAAGWEKIGETCGFSKSAKRYVYHGQPKTVWIKPLQDCAVGLLTQPTLPFSTMAIMQYSIPFSKPDLEALECAIRQLPDIRKAKGKRHRLKSMMMISICAVISGARSYAAIGECAARCTQSQLKRLGARYDYSKKLFIAPSESTLRRSIQSSDAVAVDGNVGDWVASVLKNTTSAIALDGKVVKGAVDSDSASVNRKVACESPATLHANQPQLSSECTDEEKA
jgi:hypothetical protein